MPPSEPERGVPRSFPVTVTPSWALPMLALAGWYVLLVGLGVVVGFQEYQGPFMVVGVVSAIATSVLMMRLAMGRAGSLVVSRDAVTLGSRSVARAGLRLTMLSWKQPHLWTVLGTALELEGPLGKVRIGGTGHLPPRRVLPVATRVDATLSATDFVAVARELGVERELSAGASDVTEIDLAPSRTGARGALRGMAPWLMTMALAGAVGIVGSALGLEQSPVGLAVMMGLSIVVVVGGLGYTIWKSTRPPTVRYRLVVGRGKVVVVDTRSEVGGLSMPAAPREIHRVTYRYATRMGTYEFPALRLDLAGVRPWSMVVGAWDPALVWATPAERTRRLDYLVGPEEWRLVVEAAGLGAGQPGQA